MNINARGVFFSQRAEISAMLKTREAGASKNFSIVNISSIGGLRALAPYASAYVPSKHAVIGLTKTAGSLTLSLNQFLINHGKSNRIRAIAFQHGPDGIRINTVCPAFIETASNIGNEEVIERVNKRMERSALRRVGKPEEVGEVIGFLSSEKASFITAVAWEVDGGYTAV